MQPDEARRIAASDLSGVGEDTLVAVVTALISEHQTEKHRTAGDLDFDHVLNELIFQRDWKLEAIHALGVEQIFVGDAVGYCGLGFEDLPRFIEEVRRIGVLSPDGLHVSIRDPWLLNDASDVVYRQRVQRLRAVTATTTGAPGGNTPPP